MEPHRTARAAQDRATSAAPPDGRRYGPAVGEPPLAADPRRWGSLVGLVGATTFITAYSPVLGPVVSATTRAAGLVGVTAALFAHYVRPVRLGPLVRPRRLALLTYGGCVLAELALLASGSRLLASTGHDSLRPALIAAVVGLHFLPMSWAFQERLFLYLGTAVTALGAAGLVSGRLGLRHAPEAAAVAAGLVMLALITTHARGRFVRPSV